MIFLDAAGYVFRFALLLERGLDGGGERAGVRALRQPEWARAQLHAGGNGGRRARPGDRICRGPEVAERCDGAGGPGGLRSSSSEPGDTRICDGKLIPTTENIAIAAWKRLEPAVTAAGGARLSRVRVYETPEIFAEYRGGL